jgi:hypothetical protein
VPSIVAALPSLSVEAQRQIADELRQRLGSQELSDWHSLNVTRTHGVEAVAALAVP